MNEKGLLRLVLSDSASLGIRNVRSYRRSRSTVTCPCHPSFDPRLIFVCDIGRIPLDLPFIILISFLPHPFPLPKDHEAFIFTHDPPPSSLHMLQHIVVQHQPRIHIWKLQNMLVEFIGTLDVGVVVVDCGRRRVLLVIVEVP